MLLQIGLMPAQLSSIVASFRALLIMRMETKKSVIYEAPLPSDGGSPVGTGGWRRKAYSRSRIFRIHSKRREHKDGAKFVSDRTQRFACGVQFKRWLGDVFQIRLVSGQDAKLAHLQFLVDALRHLKYKSSQPHGNPKKL